VLLLAGLVLPVSRPQRPDLSLVVPDLLLILLPELLVLGLESVDLVFQLFD
jgi:hypothetical protein